MRVWRVVRITLPVFIVLAIVFGLVAVFTTRPDQQHAKRQVNEAWAPLAENLNRRYVLLVAADEKVRGVPGPVRQLADSVRNALQRWQAAGQRPSIEPQVRAANMLEALGRRLIAAATQSDRVQADQDVKAAVADFSQAATAGERVAAYNAAVRRYARERRGPVRGLVASVLGHDDIPAFEPATEPADERP
jgi:hypothetical protein